MFLLYQYIPYSTKVSENKMEYNLIILRFLYVKEFNLGYQSISKLDIDKLPIIETACRNNYFNDSTVSFTVMAPVNSLSSIIITEIILPNIQLSRKRDIMLLYVSIGSISIF